MYVPRNAFSFSPPSCPLAATAELNFVETGLKTSQDFFGGSGLPDFSWYNTPKREKIKPYDHKIYPTAIKYAN
jgi:hypothetical protein